MSVLQQLRQWHRHAGVERMNKCENSLASFWDVAGLTTRRRSKAAGVATPRNAASTARTRSLEVSSLPPLPGVAQEIADVIGRQRTLYLLGQLPRCVGGGAPYPGKKASQVVLYVPKAPDGSHPLVRLMGQDDASALAEAFGGELLKPPTCAEIYRTFRNASIVKMASDGVSGPELATIFALTRRCIAGITPAGKSGNPPGGSRRR